MPLCCGAGGAKAFPANGAIHNPELGQDGKADVTKAANGSRAIDAHSHSDGSVTASPTAMAGKPVATSSAGNLIFVWSTVQLDIKKCAFRLCMSYLHVLHRMCW